MFIKIIKTISYLIMVFGTYKLITDEYMYFVTCLMIGFSTLAITAIIELFQETTTYKNLKILNERKK